MNENKETKELTTEHLAMEVLKQEQRKSKALIFGLTAGLIISGISTVATTVCGKMERENLVQTNYQNDCEWRKLFSEYDYISQDGNGENYYNSNVSGEANNGATGQE